MEGLFISATENNVHQNPVSLKFGRMYNNWNESSKKLIVYFILCALCMSCKQSCFQVITQNNVAYWARYWKPDDPRGCIVEYSKKDSTVRYLNEGWTYFNSTPALWGLKFRITNDTLFHYVNRKGRVTTYDTLPIISYSRDTIIFKNEKSEYIKWHRLSQVGR